MRLPVLTSAAVAATLVAAAAGPAAAATEPQKGTGSAVSSGSLATLSVAGQALEALRLQLPTSTSATGSSALVSVTPLLSGGAPVVPAVEVPAGSSKELPSQTAGLPGLVELTSPSGTLSAAADATSALAQVSTGVGDLRLLGTDLLGEGSFSVTSKVTEVGAAGTKHLVVDGLTLPTLADVLAALGLDLAKLPVGTLLELLEVTKLLDPAILTDLRTLVDGLGLTTVGDLLGALEGDLTDAQTADLLETADAPADVVTAVGSLQTAISTLGAQVGTQSAGVRPSVITVPTTPIGGAIGGVIGTPPGGTVGGGTGTTVEDLTGGALGGVLDQLPADLVEGLEDDLTAVLQNPGDVAALQKLITTLTQALVDLVKDLLDTVLGGQLAAVADLPALLDTPLLSLAELDVTTVARTGADELADVTGTVTGLEVIGTDVLDAVLGSTTVDLPSLLTGGALGQVQGLVDSTLGSVTDVLADAGVVFPLPEVEVLRVVEEMVTDVDGVRTARAGVEALSLTWALDDLVVPAPLSSVVGGVTGGLPVSLPLGGVTASALPTDQLQALLSQPLALTIGSLVDTSGFTPGAPTAAPGTPGTPGTGTGNPGSPTTVVDPAPTRQLPRTGASALLAGVALALLGGAYALRRRTEGLPTE